jgi:hypothetical protein
MSLDVGRYRLLSAHKALLERWEETRLVWQDVVREEFAKEHLEPFAPTMLATLGAIDQLTQVLVRLRQECGEGGGMWADG